ncbi:MAG: CBS domain-containing protein, partial [Gemmatimonadales bacterium]
MISGDVAAGALVIGRAAAVWAGLLALAAEARVVQAAADRTPAQRTRREPLASAFLASRLALLLIAGTGIAVGLGWWTRSPSSSFSTIALGIALLYLVADVLPRGLGVLAPRLAEAVLPLARRTLEPFRPLLGLLGTVERGLSLVVPPAVPRVHGPSPEERDILARVLALRESTVEDVMTPRLDVYAIDAESDWRELVKHARRGGHARIPVFRGDLDDVVGIIYAKDLTPAVSGVQEPPADWHQLMRPAHFVPESK